MCCDGGVNEHYDGNHSAVYVSLINTLYFLNFHNILCQLHLSTDRKKSHLFLFNHLKNEINTSHFTNCYMN